MRELYKRVKSLSVLLLVFTGMPAYLLLGFEGSAFAVDAYSSQTWQTDLEWGLWTSSNIELNGSGDETNPNSGIRLKQEGSGYVESGETTYRFTTQSVNNWIRAVTDGDKATSISSKYLWAAIYNEDSVSQIDTENGEVVKEWDVGDNPSRTAVGCNNDVWVGNRSDHSISHIIPAENKVITRSLDGGVSLKYPRAVSIMCDIDSEGNDDVFIGANGYLIKFSAQDFDDLPVDGNVVDIQEGNTLSLYPGHPNGTYGSAIGADTDNSIDSGKRFIYVSGLDPRGSGDQTYPTYQVDISKFDQAGYKYEPGWPIRLGRYVLTNDNYGNVWRDGRVVRMSPNGSTKEFHDPGGSIGILIIPNHPDGSDKIAYIDGDNLVIGDLVDNNTSNPRIENITYRPFRPDGAINQTTEGGPVGGGGLGYDGDYDIWFLPRKTSWMAEFKRSEHYSTAHEVSPTAKSGGAIYSYSDFVGNALSNTIPAQTVIEYSTNSVDYYQANADGSFPDEITPSRDLYIKIKMTGSGTNSPLLRSLKVEYEPESQANLKIIRKTFSSILGRESDASESTFEKNETVYVRLVLFQAGPDESGTTLTDRFSNFKDPKDYRFKQGCTGIGTILNPSIGVNEIVFSDLDIPSGLSCIDYEYKVQ